MNRNQLQFICGDIGIELHVNDNCIKEMKGYYENYNQIETDDAGWYFSEMNFEKRPSPEKEGAVNFISEEKAIKFFFLKTLQKFFFQKIHTPNHPIHRVQSFEELETLFRHLGIEDKNYSFNQIMPQEVYAEAQADKIIVSYIDENMQKRFTTMPLEAERGFFVIYRLTYALHLLKMIESTYLERGVLTEEFNDDDIVLFIK
ncbi:hypothetical protein D3P09_16620 [Paenibacillus pinisoli]|uniref:Uncharacterized protein n=1 Tax=Paenibacillus pinisoli TaxID=1276110 RepID=A0A3A6PHA3_9BACL|nr:hypothetical protein [Paenibacillus pinisoli]RJX39116.1 hypothetical protein D3P09_16620 [Paenibacillus pinisoli]